MIPLRAARTACRTLLAALTSPDDGKPDAADAICARGDLICAAPESAFNITALPKTLEVLSGGAGQPVHAMYATPDFWNIDGMPATQWTLNWAQNLIANAPQPKHG